jgi:cell division protein FtsB
MAGKTQLTPFARMLLFLVIFLPLAYFGAAYYNGEDPVGKVKEMVGVEKAPAKAGKAPAKSSASGSTNRDAEVADLLKENRELRKRIEELEKALQEAGGTVPNRQKWGK